MASALHRAAHDLLARALRHRDPGVGLVVLLGGAGAGRVVGLAVVLPGPGHAVALLDGHPALGLRRRGKRQGTGEGGGDGNARGGHAMLRYDCVVLIRYFIGPASWLKQGPATPCSSPATSCAIRRARTGASARSNR